MTAAGWFTEAGLLGADPGVDPRLLRELYADRQLSTREVAAEMGINKARVIRALTAAGIPGGRGPCAYLGAPAPR